MGKKEKKDKKEKKERREKKRKRSDSSDSEDERAQARVRKEAERLAKALQKGAGPAPAEDGDVPAPGRFVWKKKLEKELQGGAKTKDIYARERANTEAERLAEIEKVRRRREEREREREQRELEQEQLARDRAAADAIELEKKEDEFHLENAKARARHRLKEGREKPIDILVRDLMLGGEFPVSPAPPFALIEGLPLGDIQELREDILEYQELDSQDEEHAAWWEALLLICDEELKEASRQDAADRAKFRGEQPPEARRGREVGVHSAVDAEINTLLSGQTHSELLKMEADLKYQLESRTAPDPEFYSAILRRLVGHKAKALLREMHATLRAQSLAAPTAGVDIPESMGWRQEYLFREPSSSPEPREERLPTPEPADLPDRREPDESAGAPGQWSPPPLEPGDYASEDVVPEEDDARELQLLRAEVKRKAAASFGVAPRTEAPQQAKAPSSSGREAEDMDESTRRLRALAAKSMGDINDSRDAPFGGEVQLESKVYWWNDKYRPRKPKYFNRVHTGYEWNKYNQTHYDHDNPPPKVVQGYKFNVFYPDLIDKKAAPEYSIEKDPAADEFGSTCILRFKAGPPYEDLTFRILNKEWEYSHKKGFKCVFDRDTLYLYFNFKRQRYRR